MKFEKVINLVIPIFGGVLLLIMVGLTFVQIVLREFFDYTFNWSDEVAQFCMSWLALFGSIWVTQNNLHLNTGLKLHRKLNKKLICLIDSILALLVVVIAVVVAYQGVIYSLMTMNQASLSLTWIKMGCVFIALPLFMLAVCYYYLKSFFENMTRIFKKVSAPDLPGQSKG
jgi:TRAP-type C4-dicarboxylate transport system permease small subunit